MSLAQRILKIFFYIFIAQMTLIGLWVLSELYFTKKSFPEYIVSHLVNVDRSIIEGATLQHKLNQSGARDLILYRLLELNSVDSVEFIENNDPSELMSTLKLEECNKISSSLLCTRSNSQFMTSLIPMEFDGVILGFIKLEKSLRGLKETNKKILITVGLTTLGIFLINLLTIYMVLSRFLRPQTQRLLTALSLETRDHEIQINEFNQIQDNFLTVLSKVKLAEAEKSRLESRIELVSLSTQVAHDIRSPLETLKGLKDDLKLLPEKSRRRIWTSVQRIEEIAYYLLKTHRDSTINSGQSVENINLLKMIHTLISEKRVEYKDLAHFEIDIKLDDYSYSLFSKFNRNTLHSILSNIINNAIQSFHHHEGSIIVKLESHNNKNMISISDNGQGILPQTQNQVFEKGFTTKDDGNGLGLYHAKVEVEKYGGTISFKTQNQKGTTFTISLPAQDRPPLFPNSINLYSYKEVIILDDDPSCHELWEKRFDNIEIPVHHFYSSTDLFSKYDRLSSEVLLICDFELQEEMMDGISCIKKLNHELHSILITARDEEKEILERCIPIGLPLLPKELMNHIPIRAPLKYSKHPPPIVLIDNDRYMHINWSEFCSKYNLPFKSFFTVMNFMELHEGIQKDCYLFIDSSLDEGVRGELEAKKIFEMGFENIFISTGYSKEYFSEMSWIKDIIGKNPEGIIEHIKSTSINA